MNSIEFSPAFLLGPIAELDPSFASLAPEKSVPPSRGLYCDISMNLTRTQSTRSREFCLDTFFNCAWISSPHVYSFNPDEPIERQKHAPLTPTSPRVNAEVPSAYETYAAPKSVLPQGLSHKPWKNIAITEFDDAEFEELKARWVSASEVANDGLVYTWPPDLAAYRREVEEVRGSCEAAGCADEDVAPASFDDASPTVSASTEARSPMMSTSTQRDAQATDVSLDSLAEPEVGTLEKVVGLKRLRRKAPPPLCVDGKQAEYAISKIGWILLNGDGEHTTREIRVSFSCHCTRV
ncbi:hypothetical protein DFH29DRAFT_226801 [Suillus ampliporus]|nr:hypothetical protein DFH29DRAFT_226801 [Suillus ampliporus]